MKRTFFYIYFVPIILVVFFLINKDFKYNFKEYEIPKVDEKKIEYFIKDYMYQYNEVMYSLDIFDEEPVYNKVDISLLEKFFIINNVNFYNELNQKLFNSKNGKYYIKILKPNEPEIKKIIKEDNYFRVSLIITYEIEKLLPSDIPCYQYEKEYLELIILKIYNEDGSSSFVIDKFENQKIL